MDIRQIDATVSVSTQITAADVAEIVELGFRSILCNRPNGEGSNQPRFDQIEKAAVEAGLEVRFQPVISGRITAEDAVEFAQAMADLPQPVFAYCRTGTRCAMLWSLSQKGQRPGAEILATAAAAGYDLSALTPRLITGR